jgi:DNA-binding GntR family transcriptional regulator
MSTSFSEHNGIVEALIAGDAEAASERLRQHILVQGERFTDLLASIASLRAKNDAQSAETTRSPIFPL